MAGDMELYPELSELIDCQRDLDDATARAKAAEADVKELKEFLDASVKDTDYFEKKCDQLAAELLMARATMACCADEVDRWHIAIEKLAEYFDGTEEWTGPQAGEMVRKLPILEGLNKPLAATAPGREESGE